MRVRKFQAVALLLFVGLFAAINVQAEPRKFDLLAEGGSQVLSTGLKDGSIVVINGDSAKFLYEELSPKQIRETHSSIPATRNLPGYATLLTHHTGKQIECWKTEADPSQNQNLIADINNFETSPEKQKQIYEEIKKSVGYACSLGVMKNGEMIKMEK